jgi:molybdenum cofactor cytidylyltransferase
MSRCGIIVLAAGASRRLGRAKQLLELDGVTLLRRAVQTALCTCGRPVVVVLGAQSEDFLAQLAGLSVHVVINANWEAGIGGSIRAGVAEIVAAQPACDAALLMLCDQPLVGAEMLEELMRRQATTGKAICAAAYSGTVGTPVVFARNLFGELMQLADHEGGKVVIARHGDEVASVEIPQAALDIDTEADFARLAGSKVPLDE